MRSNIDGFIEGARSVRSPADLTTLMESHVRTFGFDRFAFWGTRSIDEGDRRTITNYDPVWSEHYLAAGYVEIDPVIRQARDSPFPFDWSCEQPADELQGAFFEEARSFGIRSGASYPIHCPDGNRYALSVSAACSLSEMRARLRNAGQDLHLIACYAHIALGAMPGPKAAHPTVPVRLTGREREVLLWTSRGKTIWEVSGIIGITERTVKFHIQNAMQKLGVYNKTHAVVRAIMAGLIEP